MFLMIVKLVDMIKVELHMSNRDGHLRCAAQWTKPFVLLFEILMKYKSGNHLQEREMRIKLDQWKMDVERRKKDLVILWNYSWARNFSFNSNKCTTLNPNYKIALTKEPIYQPLFFCATNLAPIICNFEGWGLIIDPFIHILQSSGELIAVLILNQIYIFTLDQLELHVGSIERLGISWYSDTVIFRHDNRSNWLGRKALVEKGCTGRVVVFHSNLTLSDRVKKSAIHRVGPWNSEALKNQGLELEMSNGPGRLGFGPSWPTRHCPCHRPRVAGMAGPFGTALFGMAHNGPTHPSGSAWQARRAWPAHKWLFFKKLFT